MSRDAQMNNPWMAAQQAVLDESVKNMRRLAALPGLWDKARQVRKGVTPSEVVYREDGIRLLHYMSESQNGPKFDTPLIFVFALLNRPYVLDLLPGRSVVQHFLKAGFDTYLIDWGVPTEAQHQRTLTDYVDGYLPRIVDRVRRRTGADQVNLLGYCMGGTMSTMFTALHPEQVRNLILLAAGIDFSTRDGLLNLWTDPAGFDVDGFVDAFGNVPPEFLGSMFLMLRPVGNFIEKPINLWERLDDETFVAEYMTMETWINDNIPIPGEVFREFVKSFYQKNLLVKNKVRIGGRTVNLRNITCPVLNLMAIRDDLVPCAQSEPLNDLVGSEDRRSVKLAAGHIGLAVGSRAQKELWPQAVEWLAERCNPA